MCVGGLLSGFVEEAWNLEQEKSLIWYKTVTYLDMDQRQNRGHGEECGS